MLPRRYEENQSIKGHNQKSIELQVCDTGTDTPKQSDENRAKIPTDQDEPNDIEWNWRENLHDSLICNVGRRRRRMLQDLDAKSRSLSGRREDLRLEEENFEEKVRMPPNRVIYSCTEEKKKNIYQIKLKYLSNFNIIFSPYKSKVY